MCYQHCVGDWGIQPAEFWAMTLQEYYWLADHHYVKARSQEDRGFVSQDEWSSIRDIHAGKTRKVGG